jgi:hypothetical protein
MKKQTKTSKTQPQPSPAFARWLRSIPTGDGKVVIQPPISLTQTQWAMLAVDAARQKVSLNELIQGSVNNFVGMVQEDLTRAA